MKMRDYLKAATKAPWELDRSRRILGQCFTGELKSICDLVRGGNAKEADANAALIAHLRNHAEPLVELVAVTRSALESEGDMGLYDITRMREALAKLKNL